MTKEQEKHEKGKEEFVTIEPLKIFSLSKKDIVLFTEVLINAQKKLKKQLEKQKK